MDENETWNEIILHISAKDIEKAENIANMVVPYGIYTEDYSNLENEVMEIAHIDLIDEKLLNQSRDKAYIHIYIEPHENPFEAVSFITERLGEADIEFQWEICDCKTEDWANNWKKYFHPIKVGKKLLIRPIWEDDFNVDGRKVLNIEPGLAFGTGSHPTTKLCLETLEKYIDKNSKVLDIGCGSGILSIACLLLDAKSALGVDIDPLAVKTALQNAADNKMGKDKFNAVCGNLSDKVSGKYNVIVANIVADVIIEFNKSAADFLDENGIYITGGIIKMREEEVLNSFENNGFEPIERYEEKGWLVFAVKKC